MRKFNIAMWYLACIFDVFYCISIFFYGFFQEHNWAWETTMCVILIILGLVKLIWNIKKLKKELKSLEEA